MAANVLELVQAPAEPPILGALSARKLLEEAAVQDAEAGEFEKPPSPTVIAAASSSDAKPFDPMEFGIGQAMMRMERAGGKKAKNSELYSEENVRKRLDLMKDPDILNVLEQLWTSANTDASDAIIDEQEYKVMHRKILLALDPATTPGQWKVQAEKDWKLDSEGTPGLDQKRFYWMWFELADVYTKTIDAEAYCRFLTRMLNHIVKEDRFGTAVYAHAQRTAPRLHTPFLFLFSHI